LVETHVSWGIYVVQNVRVLMHHKVCAVGPETQLVPLVELTQNGRCDAFAGKCMTALRHQIRIKIRQLAHVARSVPPGPMRLPRLAWFNVKRALQIPTRSDRPFLIEEFVRRLRAGSIGRQCHITSERSDGAGAQAMTRMATLCLAKTFGLTYVHEPFRLVAHAEGLPDEGPRPGNECSTLGSAR
jgi:hypothetical protein